MNALELSISVGDRQNGFDSEKGWPIEFALA